MSAPAAASVRTGLAEVPGEFLHAKLRARKSHLYEGERLRELAREAGVVELATRLYPQEQIGDQFELEHRMRADRVAELAHYADFVGGRRRALYLALLRRYTVENVKLLLRVHRPAAGAAPHGAPAEGLATRLPPLLDVPVDQLMASADVAEFVDRVPLEGPRHSARELLRHAEACGGKPYVEMALDRGYWTHVRDALQALPPWTRARVADPVGCEFTAMWLLACVRAGGVYGLTWEDFAPFLPEPWESGQARTWREVFEEPTGEAVAQQLPLVRRVAPDLDLESDAGALEDLLWRETVRLARRTFYGAPDGFTALVGYFYIARAEMRHLLSLTQLLRQGRSTDEVVDYLTPENPR